MSTLQKITKQKQDENTKRAIDVSDLTDEDMRFLLVTIETLRKKNNQLRGLYHIE